MNAKNQLYNKHSKSIVKQYMSPTSPCKFQTGINPEK